MKTRILAKNLGLPHHLPNLEVVIEHQTVARIRVGESEYSAVITCSDKDKFSRTAGLKLALARAFKQPTLDKSERRLIWQEVLRDNERRKLNLRIAEQQKQEARQLKLYTQRDRDAELRRIKKQFVPKKKFVARRVEAPRQMVSHAERHEQLLQSKN